MIEKIKNLAPMLLKVCGVLAAAFAVTGAIGILATALVSSSSF